jgi:hypothetical protein
MPYTLKGFQINSVKHENILSIERLTNSLISLLEYKTN